MCCGGPDIPRPCARLPALSRLPRTVIVQAIGPNETAPSPADVLPAGSSTDALLSPARPRAAARGMSATGTAAPAKAELENVQRVMDEIVRRTAAAVGPRRVLTCAGRSVLRRRRPSC